MNPTCSGGLLLHRATHTPSRVENKAAGWAPVLQGWMTETRLAPSHSNKHAIVWGEPPQRTASLCPSGARQTPRIPLQSHGGNYEERNHRMWSQGVGYTEGHFSNGRNNSWVIAAALLAAGGRANQEAKGADRGETSPRTETHSREAEPWLKLLSRNWHDRSNKAGPAQFPPEEDSDFVWHPNAICILHYAKLFWNLDWKLNSQRSSEAVLSFLSKRQAHTFANHFTDFTDKFQSRHLNQDGSFLTFLIQPCFIR